MLSYVADESHVAVVSYHSVLIYVLVLSYVPLQSRVAVVCVIVAACCTLHTFVSPRRDSETAADSRPPDPACDRDSSWRPSSCPRGS